MKKLLIPYAAIFLAAIFVMGFNTAAFYGPFGKKKAAVNDLHLCVQQTEGTDGDCEWCDMLCADRSKTILKTSAETIYSLTFVERTESGTLNTFALDNLTETEYKLFINHSKPL